MPQPLKFQVIHQPDDSGLSIRYPGVKIQFAMKKRIFPSATILAAAVNAYVQDNGQADTIEATSLITGYFNPETKLVYAIGAVYGLIGGAKVYNEFSGDDPGTSKTAASRFRACIFLTAAATILRLFFLQTSGYV